MMPKGKYLIKQPVEFAYSRCCNAKVDWVKGSYMGSFDAECSSCGKYCHYYIKTEYIEKIKSYE